ncbi:MAG: hypothetical protein ABUS57_02375 [Pseudomonadota bacterium]
MKFTHVCLAAALTSLALCAPAFAEENDDNDTCMVETPVNAALVEAAGENGFTAVPNAISPAILHGALSATRDTDEADASALHGAVFFVRNAAGEWRAVLPSAGEDTVAVYSAPTTGALIVLTMLQTEGPGPAWTLIRSTDGFVTGDCTPINFPAELNHPDWANEFVELKSLGIDAHGAGELIGVAHTERGGHDADWWYIYRTRDGGATWSAPRRISREQAARAGIYQPVEDSPAPEDQVQDLQRYAAAH